MSIFFSLEHHSRRSNKNVRIVRRSSALLRQQNKNNIRGVASDAVSLLRIPSLKDGLIRIQMYIMLCLPNKPELIQA
jgi:hypothetical protein